WLVTAIGALFLVAMPSAAPAQAPAQANMWSVTATSPPAAIYTNATASTVQVLVTVCINPTAQAVKVTIGPTALLEDFLGPGQCASVSASVPASTSILVKPFTAGTLSAGTYSITVK